MAVTDELKIHNSIYAFIIIILLQQVPLVALCVYLPCSFALLKKYVLILMILMEVSAWRML